MKVKDRYIGMWFQLGRDLYVNNDQNEIYRLTSDGEELVELDPEATITLDVTDVMVEPIIFEGEGETVH